ncbi:MAG: hypothetical protein DI531_08065 [Brevundimonas sp.]|nr:MAG: hypothetical protein DI531_08065 [Brevundimonas sp.]
MLSRRIPLDSRDGAGLIHNRSRFVPKVNETCLRGCARLVGRRRRARLTALLRRLLARLCLDRERRPARQRDQRQTHIGKAPASPA